MKKQFAHRRKASEMEFPKENLWFFSENSSTNDQPANKRKTARNDQESIIQGDIDRFGTGFSDTKNSKTDCTFVVDWQMSDAF